MNAARPRRRAAHASGLAVVSRAADFAEPLRLCHRSLADTGNQLIADGRLADLLRRAAAFGLTLAPLDIRQESSKHADAVDWIARRRGLGAFRDAPEEARVALLLVQLAAPVAPLTDPEIADAPDAVRDVLETFRIAASLHAESLGAYVITMTHAASDLLAVDWLQQLAGTAHPQRVVPLFETADDLASAPAILDALLAVPSYQRARRTAD